MIIKTYGEYRDTEKEYGYNVIMIDDEHTQTIGFISNEGKLVSAYKKTETGSYSYANNEAKKAFEYLYGGYKYCTPKNKVATPFKLGIASTNVVEKGKVAYCISRYGNAICGCEISSETKHLYLQYDEAVELPDNIPWISLVEAKKPKRKSKVSLEEEFEQEENLEETVVVRSISEISLEKDITWLKNKRYFIVNEDADAENLFTKLEEYIKVSNGTIAYDTETSGLRINMFGKVGSSKKKELEDYNKNQIENNEDPIRVDSLTGIIFCIKENESFYMPVRNRKFKNLYEVTGGHFSVAGAKVVSDIYNRYTTGIYKDRTDDMAEFIRNTPAIEWGCDVILMERCRYILEKGNLCAHNGIFEWKVSWLYNIDINLKDDTMTLHKLMLKFRSTTSNKGERSDLKFLTGKEFNVEQLDLKDFFLEYEEDVSGTVKGNGKKKSRYIDFSYMDYDGSRYYAPADGDFTLALYHRYKRMLLELYPNLEYLYNVEILTSCAIAYMEFYGHRIDEEQIENTKVLSLAKQLIIENKLRKLIGYSTETEDKITGELARIIEAFGNKIKERSKLTEEDIEKLATVRKEIESLSAECTHVTESTRGLINDSDKKINLASPQQVSNLLYVIRNVPPSKDDKGNEVTSVGKKVLKQYVNMKDSDGNAKYPEVNLYLEWKNLDTLLSKFFGKLPEFMYPGGYIFSSYGQISTATGRMSCNKPNAQQYPKSITGIVIPRPKYVFIDADFSQIEYRTLVAMANEPSLKKQFEDPDVDYHTMMAALMFDVPYASVTPKMRSDAKSFNFGIPYGMGFGSLAILLHGAKTAEFVEDAKVKYDLYFKDQPNVKAFFVNVKEAVSVYRKTKTLFGREREYSFLDKEGKYSKKQASMALRQAGNAVIQGTAADIFKIATARTFSFIRENGLLGDFLITNMIHDELLTEVNCEKLNVQVALASLVKCMELDIKGFPPLFVGAGVGTSWSAAKGKDAEIHPNLANEFISEVDGLGIKVNEPKKVKDVLAYFDERVYKFREKKVEDYIKDSKNWNQPIHPVIGNLLGLQFDYGVTKQFNVDYPEDTTKKEVREKKLTEIPVHQLEKFISSHNMDVDYRLFYTPAMMLEEEAEDDDYDDSEEDINDIDLTSEVMGGEFALIDESDELFGVDARDLIREFGMYICPSQGICGIDKTKLSRKKIEDLGEYLQTKLCDKEDPESLRVVFLTDGNILLNSPFWVKDIEGSKMSTMLHINSLYN